MPNSQIKSAAVLGAGTMGARIAAHLANAGIDTFLLDVASPEGERNRAAQEGLRAALAARPPAFFTRESAQLITTGNFEDNLEWCRQADWIIEAVAENIEIKRAFLSRVELHRRPAAIISTNTSGLSIARLAEERSEDFRRHFAGTHFFNPPRYLRLVELIPSPNTLPEVINTLRDFCTERLGKGIVMAKDTPNFIANRIGTFSFLDALRHMAELEMTVEEVDACTGPITGRPKSATFRTADMVGLDVVAQVVRNLHEHAIGDESRETFKLPAFIEEMMRRGWLGDKAGEGFYKRERKTGGEEEILALDLKTMTYRPRQKAHFGMLDMAKTIGDTRDRLRAIVASARVDSRGKRSGDKAGEFVRRMLQDTCMYAARRVPKISDSIMDVDCAMRLGFGWELGPFETWDALGIETMTDASSGKAERLPPLAEALLESGKQKFYEQHDGATTYFDIASHAYKPEVVPEGVIFLRRLHERGRAIESNTGASLVDLGDGVLCCEFHSKMNTIGGDAIAMIYACLRRLHSDFDGMIIANQAENFSAGANLLLLLVNAQDQDWDEIDLAVRQFQHVNMAIKHAAKPVVAAPQGMALGGGCEIALHARLIHASAEAYLGLVEKNVGLIPAGGGTKEMMIRANERVAGGLDAAMNAIFKIIATAKVSTSAEEAREIGFLRPMDKMTMNRDRLIGDAKQTALEIARTVHQAATSAPIQVLGEPFLSALKSGVEQELCARRISEHDALVAGKLAFVMAGGMGPPREVSEEYLLDLEREAFVSLCGEEKTQERMAHMLKTGKPLHN